VDETTRQKLIHEHLEAIRQLQASGVTPAGAAAAGWPPKGYYLVWHIVVGMALGGIGAAVALAANALGAQIFDKHPLELIRVFLTFPMGEEALQAESGQVLTVGCIRFLLTGALHGIVFHLVMSLFFGEASKVTRFIVATIMGLALWIGSFYLVLSWLQPLLLGGNWIISEIPWWVGALTHLAFAWTMLLGEFWGKFDRASHAQTTAPPPAPPTR